MRIPFTVGQFFAVFEQYNTAVWPAQLILLLLAVVAVAFIVWPRPRSGVIVSAILAALWAWMGLTYHLVFFSRVNPLAFVFSALSVLGALAFLWWGVVRRRVRFERPSGWRVWVGSLLLAYALLIYPALSSLAGHPYFGSPTFGLPCPTTIFTFGVLAFLAAPFPRVLFVVPVVWSLIGAQAAFLLAVPQDIGLLVAGVLGVILAFRSQAGQRHELASSSGSGERTG